MRDGFRTSQDLPVQGIHELGKVGVRGPTSMNGARSCFSAGS